MPDNTIQQRLLGMVQDQIPDKYSLVFELSELLGISTDSVYRRLRCETLMDITEIQKICLHYNISFDSVCGCEGSGLISFQYKPIKELSDFNNWLSILANDLKALQNKENVHVIYAAIDIPIFHNFRFPLVSYFKSLYWLKSITNHPDFQDVKFSLNKISDEFVLKGQAMHQLYAAVPSTEIWTDLITYSLIRQIDFYWDSGEFATKDDALALCSDVEKEFEYLNASARAGSKTPDKPKKVNDKVNFLLYDCDIEIATNCVFVINDNHKTVYLSTQTFNIIKTSNEIFVEESYRWLNSLLKKSTLISDVGEKQRNLFFKEAFDHIAKLKKKISES